jgi:hypothetical protein
MFEKDGKFYADWRDRTGKRKRKSSTSQRAALRFEMEQKELAHPKTKALGKQSRTFSAPPILKLRLSESSALPHRHGGKSRPTKALAGSCS